MTQPQRDRGVDVLSRGEPVLEHPHSAVEVGHQEEVHDETGPVLGEHGGLPQSLPVHLGELEGLVGGLEPPNQLQQLHDGGRVEEVCPDDLVGSPGRRCKFGDGERRRVRGQDHVRPGQLLQPREDLEFRDEILGGRLDHEVGVGHVCDVRGPGDPVEDGGAITLG